MNLLVVGISHRTAPMSLLERVALRAEDAKQLGNAVREAMVLSTCNRVEVYAAVSGFHGALAEIGGLLAAKAGVDIHDLAPHLNVRYDDEAVRHVFRVAAGLDSMVVGEQQILGQLRDAYGSAENAGRTLHELVQHALKAGKRVRTETRIDDAGRNTVTAALELGLARTGIVPRKGLVVGTGAMGRLALATLRRAGVHDLTVAGRSPDKIAQDYDATPISLARLHEALGSVDVVISATSAPGEVITSAPRKPLLILDLAVPRDVSPAVADVPGVTVIDLGMLASASGTEDIAEAEAVVNEEVGAFLKWLRSTTVAPTVAALHARADELVGTELAALRRRRPELSDEQRADVARTVRRVVGQLLHQPTVRVRELAAGPDGDRYAELIRELFDPEYNPDGIKRALEIH
ncbi:glutamyl-tRNA reductase [Lentzea sp. NBRC 105346]|uniref:glutamyl-tRNA reductase n=1 Tax=Lentzea sp. NBRC 105346 TaxID=3032205 RepID=UPI0024A0818F|nr:glutamyl-tRNA reductase [Lentzea sp. NBRC 105346]GLZ36150.1 glutamyl-tRNA reductase [Lentzea sp. NBRC 105346]